MFTLQQNQTQEGGTGSGWSQGMEGRGGRRRQPKQCTIKVKIMK
jgi:hypothetical protein